MLLHFIFLTGHFNTLPARRKTEGDFPRPISNGFREGPEVIPDKPIEVPEIAGRE